MIKENYIKEYLSNINFKSDDWTVDSIKDDLKKMLGEYPAIDIIYKKDVSVNETTGEAQEIHGIEKFSVIFTNEQEKFRKIEIII
jgi:hypothetical protein|tara:strand:+ start:42 stop:296 length:255 start_codon:yes stop_codon:yes gene_type:complete